MSDVIIKAEGISKKYELGTIGAGTLYHSIWNAIEYLKGKSKKEKDAFWALDDVNFEINRGDVVGVIGKNGAGKSTLLKVLSRITEPTSGKITVNGRIASLLEVGTGFHPELSGRENIYLNGSILGMTRQEIKSKFDEIVEFSGVEKFLDTPVKRYSSGMYVRLAFAVAAHLEPEILVIDEVLSVGDAEFQSKCLGKMNDVAKSGRTVLFVSHNMGAVRKLCTKGIFLEQGRITKTGNSDDIVDYYLSKSYTSNTSKLPYTTKNKNLTIKNILLTNSKYIEVAQIEAGESLNIEIQTETIRRLDNCIIKIEVISDTGEVLSILSTFLSSTDIHTLEDCQTYKCKIDNLPLNKGLYHLNLVVKSNKQTVCELEGASKIEVIDGNFYSTGRLPKQSVRFLMPNLWE